MRAAHQFVDRREAACARRHDALGAGLGQAFHHEQAQAHGGRSAVRAGLQRALPVARAHVHRPHFDAVAARILHQLRRRIETHRLAVQQRGEEGGRVVALEPGGHIDQQGEACRMRFGKAVFAEAVDLLEDALGELARVAAFEHALDQAPLEMLRGRLCVSTPPSSGASWSASPGVKPAATTASCITCSWKIGTPSVRSSTVFDRIARIVHRLQALAAAQIGMHHAALDRAGAHDRDLDHQIVETCAASAAAAWTSARAIRSGTRPRCRPAGSCRRQRGLPPARRSSRNGRAAAGRSGPARAGSRRACRARARPL